VLAWRLFFVKVALSIHLAAQLLDDLAKVGRVFLNDPSHLV
jgi:hypothetical protein